MLYEVITIVGCVAVRSAGLDGAEHHVARRARRGAGGGVGAERGEEHHPLNRQARLAGAETLDVADQGSGAGPLGRGQCAVDRAVFAVEFLCRRECSYNFV